MSVQTLQPAPPVSAIKQQGSKDHGKGWRHSPAHKELCWKRWWAKQAKLLTGNKGNEGKDLINPGCGSWQPGAGRAGLVHHRFLFCGGEHYDGVDWNTQVERLRRRLGRERESDSSGRDILENRETLKWDRKRFFLKLSTFPKTFH